MTGRRDTSFKNLTPLPGRGGYCPILQVGKLRWKDWPKVTQLLTRRAIMQTREQPCFVPECLLCEYGPGTNSSNLPSSLSHPGKVPECDASELSSGTALLSCVS